jgi:hypothetical protein
MALGAQQRQTHNASNDIFGPNLALKHPKMEKLVAQQTKADNNHKNL